jgi:predicted transcriptional regulator
MKISEIINLLKCEVMSGITKGDIEITNCLCSDMMSDVLAFAKPGALLITGLTNAQSVRTADFAESAAILYIRGKKPDAQAIELAQELHIPILATKLGMFEACGILFREGMKGIC